MAVVWAQPSASETGVADVRVAIADDNSDAVTVRTTPPTPSPPSDAASVAARTGTAAAFLADGADPRGVVVEFTATPGIVPDAALAVAARSALSGTATQAGSTVLASVLPNGALVPAPDQRQRTAVAAQNGLSPIVVAPGSGGVDPAPAGVVEAATLDEAFTAVTGTQAEPLPRAPRYDPDLQQLVTIAAGQLIDQVRAVADDAPPRERMTLQSAVRRASAEMFSDDPFAAYATITLAQQQSEMAAAERRVTGPLAAEARSLRRALARQRRSAVDRIDLAASTPLKHVEQFPALADALTWGTGTMGLLDIADETLVTARDRRDLRTVAGLIARADYRLNTYLPLQVEAVREIGQVTADDPRSILSLLDAYAELLGGAGVAVIRALPTGSPGYHRAVAQRDVWRALPAGGTNQEPTLTRLAAALSCYIAAHYPTTVAATGMGATPPDESFFRAQTSVATSRNEQVAGQLAATGLDPSFVLWGSRWGLAWATPQPGDGTDMAVRATGLTYQWYATIQGQMALALAP